MYDNLYRGYDLPASPTLILQTASKCIHTSNEYLDSKRPIWDVVRKLYRDAKRDPTSVQYRGSDLFSVIDFYRSTDISRNQTSAFEPVDQSPLADERARFFTKNWEEDYKTMRYADEEDESKMNMYITGLGVLYFPGWDRERVAPILHAVETERVLLDPQGGVNPDNHRWLGFSYRYHISDLLQATKDFFPRIVESYLKAPHDTRDGTTQDVDESYREASGFDSTIEDAHTISPRGTERDEGDAHIGLGSLDVYDLYLPIGDKRYFITVDQKCEKIFRCKEYKPVSASARANLQHNPLPVSFKHFMPIYRSDPIGIAPYEIIASDQIIKSTMINLTQQRVAKNLTAPLIMRAGMIDKVPRGVNANDMYELNLPDGMRLSDVFTFGNTNPVPLNEIVTMIDLMNKQISDNTGVTDVKLGSPSPQPTPLGETNLRDEYSSIRRDRQLLGSEEAREDLVRRWFGMYQRHLTNSASQKKTIEIQIGEVSVPQTLSPAMFDADIPNIRVSTPALMQGKRQQKAQQLYALLNSLQATGDHEGIVHAQREILKLEGWEAEDIDRLVPESPLVKIIRMENVRLAANIPLELPEDAEIHLRIRYQANIPTEAGRRRYQDLLIRFNEIQEEERRQFALQNASAPAAPGVTSNQNPLTKLQPVENVTIPG